MEVRIPAAPASAEPNPKVKAMMTLILMPMSWAATGLKESARMAMPIFVFRTMWLRPMSRTSVMPKTSNCESVIVSPEILPHDSGISMARSVMISGNDFGSAPKAKLAAVFQEQGDTDGRDQHRELGPFPQRAVAEPLDGDADDRAEHHGHQQHDPPCRRSQACPRTVSAPSVRERTLRKAPSIKDVAVRKIDEPQHPEKPSYSPAR